MLDFTNYHDDDLEEILQLFYETVHSVNAQDYSQAQLEAWAPLAMQPVSVAAWQQSLRNNKTYIARAHHQIVGFGDMTMEGYLDRLYVHKDFGVRDCIRLSRFTRSGRKKLGLTHISTDASLTARPFFERKGYQIMQTQTVERQGISLTNVSMVKRFIDEKDG